MAARALRGLEDFIEVCLVDYHYTEQGLQFSTPDKVPGCTPDPVIGARYLRELYLRACPTYEGLFSVPMLWDTHLGAIVNNESEDIVRIFNSSDLDSMAKYPQVDLFLDPHLEEIATWSIRMDDSLMKAVKSCAAATTQQDYECNANIVRDFLLKVNEILAKSKYFLGNQLTSLDIRLFSLVIRHDIINVLLGRINHVFVRDLAGIMRWIKDLLHLPGMRSIVDLEAIKGMTFSKRALNPSGIIPLGTNFLLPSE